ncbi:MAG: lipid-A-disaccharide synthase [Betaproteobacteria bacterium AqS2]|uniref:Lipid-A-disaccharide synthase n=1 Tax=Candidatus Amphirhobacter heronislandensis TaxID=1732024 RepID=A0A930UF34_9GAMM|nr:lipid-A-disaccharide synthase [Betaproteobacteria bacterium AqS2]
MKIALVCGETSGDGLGAGLARRLRELRPGVELAGVTGPAMREAGVDSWLDHGVFSIMGYAEALATLPQLLAARRLLLARLRDDRPAALVGIDAPDLNLRLAAACKKLGTPYIQYVCPSFWAWRPGRAAQLKELCKLVLAVLPFEEKLCAEQGIKARFVGHRLADELRGGPDERAAARAALGVAPEAKLVALLPGSRRREVKAHEELFAAAAAQCRTRQQAWTFAWAAPRAGLLSAAAAELGPVHVGGARLLLQAADAAILKSGTVTLEAALAGCPQVVAHRLTGMDRLLVLPKLGKLEERFFALPNLILGRELAPELMQDRARADAIAAALERQMAGAGREATLAGYEEVRAALAQDADRRAAEAVLAAAG